MTLTSYQFLLNLVMIHHYPGAVMWGIGGFWKKQQKEYLTNAPV